MLDTSTAYKLPRSERVLTAANATRGALLQFMNGVATRRWDKRSLASWLEHSYAVVTRPGSSLMLVRGGDAIRPASARTVAATEVQMTLAEAHRITIDRLRGLQSARTPSPILIAHAVRSGFVTPCEDVTGAQGWLPVQNVGMRLSDRIHSLVLADYLVRPEDYEALLTICRRCRTIEFDALSRERGYCGFDRASGATYRAVKVA